MYKQINTFNAAIGFRLKVTKIEPDINILIDSKQHQPYFYQNYIALGNSVVP